MKNPKLLIVQEDLEFSRRVRTALMNRDYEFVETGYTNVIDLILNRRPDLIIIAQSITSSAKELRIVELVRQIDQSLPIILIASNSTEELAIAAIRARVHDYVKEPYSLEELEESVCRCLRRPSETEDRARPEVDPSSLVGSDRMIGRSPIVSEIKTYIRKVASTTANVLITGETGTGKELVAELVHRNSPRSKNPFVCINCAAIPDDLLESELFGFEKGAFTGANVLNAGKLKHADTGTVFFDEIGDMSPLAQAKILRAIESKSVYRLGGNSSVSLDVRVIAATNQDLEAKVAEGKFRKDLYFRLNVTRIHLPPLRDRKEDIPGLLQYYLRELNFAVGRESESFTEEVFAKLISYDWPGNVRELKNFLEAVLINSPQRTVSFQDLPEQYRRHFGNAENMPQAELDRLVSALFSTNWNKSMAAEKLNWSRMTLYRKMAKYRLVKGGAESISRKCNIPAGDDTCLIHPRGDS